MRAQLLCLACALLTTWLSVPCLAETSVDAYAQSVMQLVHKQQESIDRLAAPADLTAKALLAGAAFFSARTFASRPRFFVCALRRFIFIEFRVS